MCPSHIAYIYSQKKVEVSGRFYASAALPWVNNPCYPFNSRRVSPDVVTTNRTPVFQLATSHYTNSSLPPDWLLCCTLALSIKPHDDCKQRLEGSGRGQGPAVTLAQTGG